MKSNLFHKLEIISFFIITIIGIINNQVTVFYIIYLFWFQEFIRTVVDFVFIISQKKIREKQTALAAQCYGSGLLLFIYFVFIIILFGFMLNWKDKKLMGDNILIFMFRNPYFNINILTFLAQYLFFRINANNENLQISVFNIRHIILHISIILGAGIQMGIVPNVKIDPNWGPAMVILPFLILKALFQKSFKESDS